VSLQRFVSCVGVGGSMSANEVRDFLDSIFSLSELLSLTENELVQLEEIEADLALEAEWWRRRRSRRRGAASNG
jgi:hypothetical protein